MVTSRLCGSRQSLLGATAAALQQYNKRDKQDKRRIPLPVIFFSSSSTEDAAALKGKKKKKKENHSIIIATQFINRPADLSRTGVSLFVNAYLLLFFLFLSITRWRSFISFYATSQSLIFPTHTRISRSIILMDSQRWIMAFHIR